MIYAIVQKNELKHENEKMKNSCEKGCLKSCNDTSAYKKYPQKNTLLAKWHIKIEIINSARDTCIITKTNQQDTSTRQIKNERSDATKNEIHTVR